MSIDEDVWGGGGSTSGGGGGISRPPPSSPSGGSNDEEQIMFNKRLQLLSDAGAGGLFQLDNDILIDLILNTQISDGEMLESFYSALDETHKTTAVDYLGGMKKESQHFFWNALPSGTQNELTQFGYELPKKDKIDFWNPWDWKDYFDEEVGSEFKKRGLNALNPWNMITSPKEYFGAAASTIAKAPWLPITGTISLIGAGASWLPRWAIEQIDAGFHKGRHGLRGFALGHEEMGSMKDLYKPFVGIVKHWDNAKYAETTYSDETINAIKDQLQDETLYEQLLYTQRYGDISEGIFRYYLDENGGDQIEARKNMEKFLASGVLASTSWRGAERYAMAGTVSYGGVFAEELDRFILNLPPALGGARQDELWGMFEGLSDTSRNHFGGYGTEYYDEEAREWIQGDAIIRGQEYYGDRDTALGEANRFWAGARTSVPLTMEIIGSIAFDPTNAGLVGIAKIRNARSAIMMRSKTTLEGYAGAVRSEREAASAIRALDELEGALDVGVPLGEAVADAGMTSRLTRGIFNGTDGSRKSVKGVLKEWAKQHGDTFFRNTSVWRKEELRSIGRKVDQITGAFRKHEIWLKEQYKLQALGQPAFQSASPLITDLVRADPRFESVIEIMAKFHEGRKSVQGTQDLTTVQVIDEMGDIVSSKRIYVDPSDVKVPVSKPGLDEWDGWWDFLTEIDGFAVMSLGLNQRHQNLMYFPRISWGAIGKNRAFLSRRKFMAKGDSLEGLRGGLWAESLIRNEGISQRLLGDVIYAELQTGKFGDQLKTLTHDEIWSATVRPQYFEEHATTLAEKWQLSRSEVDVLQELIVTQRNAATSKLYEMYESVVLKGDDLDDYIKANFGDAELAQIMKDNWVHIDEYWRSHIVKHGKPVFNEETGKLMYAPNWWKGWGREGKAYVERRRRSLLPDANGVESEHLLRFPTEVTKTTTKTWDELFHSGIDVGKVRHNLNASKINTPDELMQLLESQGTRWVAEELKMSVKDLKSFIKNDLHLYYAENKMYNAAGKLRDFGLAVAYQTAYKPLQWSGFFFKNAPSKNTIDVGVDFLNNHDQVTELKALVDMGTLGGVPTTVIDQYLTRFIFGTEGERMNIINEFLYDVMGRSGGFAYGRKKALDIFNEHALQTRHAYSNIGQDLWLGKAGLSVGAVIPAEAHMAQLSQLKTIPSWREVGRMTQHMGLLRHLGYKFGIAQLDLFFQKFWRPKVLLKMGVAPRNFFDEALQMGLRHGFGAQTDTRLAITASGRISVRDAYGSMTAGKRGDVAWTTEQIAQGDRQALLRKLAGVEPVSQANLGLFKFPAIVARKLNDVLQIGNKAIHRKAVRAAHARVGTKWDTMSDDERQQVIVEEMIKLYNDGNKPSEALLHTQFLAEWKLRELNPEYHITGQLSPFDELAPDKVAVAKKALELRGVSGERQREGVYHALNNPVIMETITEDLMRPMSPYMDDASGADLVVRSGGELDSRNVRYRLPMDPTRTETRFYTATSGSVTNMDGALQQMNWLKDEPAAVEMGVELVHHIDEPLNNFFRGIVPPGWQAPWRKTGKPPLPEGIGVPPHISDIDVKSVDTGVGSSIHRATDPLKNAEGKLEIHLDFGVIAGQYKNIIESTFKTKGANSLALESLGYNPRTFVEGLSELNLTAGHSSVPETFLNLINAERAKMGMAPKKAGDVLEEAEAFYLYSFERELAGVRLQHYEDAVSTPDLVKANQIALQQLGIPESAALSDKVPLAHPVTRIISGGQSGADIAGLRAGRALQIETGGLAPIDEKGKLQASRKETTYGKAPQDAEMRELGLEAIEGEVPDTKAGWGAYYMKRTKANVDASDGTVVFTQKDLPKKVDGGKVTGTQNTIDYANSKADYPDALVFETDKFTAKHKKQLLQWLKRNNIKTLNVAGPRQHVVEAKWIPKSPVMLKGKFGEGKVLKAADHVKSETLFDAVVNGERTALIAPKSTEVASETVRGMEEGVSPKLLDDKPIKLQPGLLERFGEGQLMTIQSGKNKVLVRVTSKKSADSYDSRELAGKLGYDYDTRTQDWGELTESHTVIEFELVAEDVAKTGASFESEVERFLTDALAGGARSYVPPAPDLTPAKQSDLRKNLETIESLGGQLDYYPQSIQDITFQNVDDVIEWGKPYGSNKPDVTVLGDVGTDYYYTYHHYHVVDEGKPVGTILRSKGAGTKEGGTKHIYVQGGWNPVIQDIKNQVEGITGYEFDTVIVQKYSSGNVDLGFHYDKETGTFSEPEAIIASVNLGASRDFVFRPRTYVDKTGKRAKYPWTQSREKEHVPFALSDKDVFLMREGTQDAWEHSLIKGKGHEGPRINLTFRRRNPAVQKKKRGESATSFRGGELSARTISEVKKMTPELLKANRDKVYLFGDNTKRTGKSGQSIIRDEPNAHGIPTKKSAKVFWTDDTYDANTKAIDKAFDSIPEGEIVIPKDGLGTGRAKLKENAPKTFKYLESKLKELKESGKQSVVSPPAGFTPAPPKPPAFAPAPPPPPQDPASQFAGAAYDKVTQMGVRPLLREFYVNSPSFEQGTMPAEINNLIKQIKRTVGATPEEEKFIRALISHKDVNDGYRNNNALAWIVNYKVNPEALVGGSDLKPILNRQLDKGRTELTTIAGQGRLRSLRAHGGYEKTMLPVNENQVEIFFPQINGDAALHLGYLFGAADGPLTNELAKALKGFLVKELGNEKLASDTFHMLNPRENPDGSMIASEWLERNIPRGGGFLGQLVNSNPPNGSVGSFMPLGRHTGVQQQTVVALAGSHNSKHAEAVGRAIEKWNEWIYSSGGQIGSTTLDDALNPMGPFKSLPSVRRLYSLPEYKADIGFNRQFNTTQNQNIPRMGEGQDIARPPSIYIAGEGWADKKGVPLGWVEERSDGVPTGKWVPEDITPSRPFESTGIPGLETELEARSVRFPEVPSSPAELASTLDRREYIEEEIVNLAEALFSLPSGSKMTYPFSATASYQRWKGDLPYYDDFGFTLNRLIKIINDHGASTTSTIAELEREIWQVLGDLPPTLGKDVLPYIGTVGGVKHEGVRRIFVNHEPTALVPNKRIEGNPIGDIAQFDPDILKPWNMRFEEVQWMQDDPSLVVGDTVEQLAQRDIGYEEETFWNYARPDEQFGPAAGLSRAKAGDIIPNRPMFQAGVKDVEEYLINRISGMPEKKLAEFLKWRQQQIDEAIDAGHIDSMWPFFRDPPQGSFDYDGAAKTILRNPDPQDYPVAFKETAKELEAKGIPFDETAKQNMPTRTAALVKSKLRDFPQSENPGALWTYDSERGASLRPRDIGGFHHGIEMVGVNPRTLAPNDVETVMDSNKLFHVWEHTKTKDIHILPDTAYNPKTKELNIPAGFNPKDYKSIGSFEAGSNDMAQFTEVQTRRIQNEMNHLLTNADRPVHGAQVNHPMLLELTDFPKDPAMSESRIHFHGNSRMLPDRMLHTMPAAAPVEGPGGAVMSGIKHLEKAFFGGYMHPVIKAGVREPMFLWYFAESWDSKALGVTEFYQHSANAFTRLEKTLMREVPKFLMPSRLSPHHKTMHNGVEQFEIPELRKFIEQLRNRRKGEDIEAIFADVVDDWMSGVKDKDMLLEQVFALPKGQVRIRNDYMLPDGTNLKGTHNLAKAYKEGAIEDVLMNRLHYDAETEFPSKGLFHRAFPGNEEFFFHLKETSTKAEYDLTLRSIMEWIAQQATSYQARVDFTMLDAAKRMSHYVDQHTKRSFFQEMVGSAIPFHFAHFQFLSRWVKTVEHNPAAIPRLNWLLFAAQQTGYRYEDERTGQMRIKIPFVETGVGIFLEVMNDIPIVQKFFGSRLLSVFEDGAGFPERFILPGYDPDNLLELQIGPILGIPLTTASHIVGSRMLDEGLLGLGENLVMNRTYDEPLLNSVFGQLMPTTFIRPFAAIMNAIGGSDIAGMYSKAEADAIMILGLKGMLPDQTDMAGRPGEAVFNQKWYDAIRHIAKVKMVIDMLTWEVVGTTPRATILSDDPAWEWNEFMQKGIDMGMPHEEAFEYMLDKVKEEFDTNFPLEYPGLSMDDPFYDDAWNKELMKVGVAGVGMTEKMSLAEQPSTKEAWEFIQEHGDWVMAAPMVHWYFVPRGMTEEETIHEPFARDWQIAQGQRVYRDNDRLATVIQGVAPSVEYYAMKEAHLRQLNVFKEARDNNRKNDIKPGVSWADMIMRQEEQWDVWDQNFKETYPIWAEDKFGLDSQMKRDETISEMRRLFTPDNLDAIPDTPIKDDVIAGMRIIVQLDNDLTQLAGVRGNNDNDVSWTSIRNNLMLDAYNQFSALASGKPWVNTLFRNLFMPFIGEDWVIKLEEGTLKLGDN